MTAKTIAPIDSQDTSLVYDSAGNVTGIITQGGKLSNLVPNYPTLAARPVASVFGAGQCQIGLNTYVSDGVTWANQGNQPLEVILSANGTLAIPALTIVDSIRLTNSAGFSVTGGINIGTTNGGADILSAYPVAANAFDCINGVSLLKQSFSVDTLLYISAVTAWNGANLTMDFFIK